MNLQTKICQNCKQNFVLPPNESALTPSYAPTAAITPACSNAIRLSYGKDIVCAKGRKSQIPNPKSQTNPKFQYTNTSQHFHGDNPYPNEFETSYAPDRPEIVYCEQCYNAEVV